jgi:prepilin-type N-terminal cleavage/methylation domain-containing protein
LFVKEGKKLRSKGFTLIEILIGLILLSVGLLAIAGMHVTSIRGNFFSHHLTQATYAAQDRLEFLNTLPYDAPALQAGGHSDGTSQISGADIVFQRSYVVTINGDLKTITYTVTWNEGVRRTISFSTIRTR